MDKKLKKPKKNKYRLNSNSLSKFVQVYEKSIEFRETNENARLATLVATVNNFASASTSQDSGHTDLEVIVLKKKRKGKGFPQSTTTEGEHIFHYISLNDF